MFAVVEDCETTRALLVNVIKNVTKNDVIDFRSAESFIRDLRIKPYELKGVFLDINLPGANGLDIIKSIKLLDSYKDVPIIICSADNNKVTILSALKAGASNFVIKPFARDQIKAVLETLLTRSEEKNESAKEDDSKDTKDDENLLEEATEKLVDN